MADAGDCKDVDCGRSECRGDIGIGVLAGLVLRGWNREIAWQDCLMYVFQWMLPLEFWRKFRAKPSLLICEFRGSLVLIFLRVFLWDTFAKHL